MDDIHDEKYYYLNNKYNMLLNLQGVKYMIIVLNKDVELQSCTPENDITLLTNVTSTSSV